MALKGLNLLSNMFASSRSSLTCTYKCGNACFGECDNNSDNTYFGDMMSRRAALRAGGLTVVTVGGGAALAACSTDEKKSDSAAGSSEAAGSSQKTSEVEVEHVSNEGMQFKAVEANKKDEVVIPEGYEQSVLIAWGDPVIEGAAEFDAEKQTPEDAEKPVSYTHL